MAFGFVLALRVILPSLLRAEGKIGEAIIGMVIGTVMNIILDPVFILLLHQDVAGKITSMVFMITVGYVSGYMTFAGYNYGAGHIRRMVSALKFTMLTATGRAVPALVVNLGRQCLFYIPLLYILNSIFHLSGLMYAQPIADFLTTTTAVLIAVPLLRKLLKLPKEMADMEPRPQTE